jgi:TatD DNase family protein
MDAVLAAEPAEYFDSHCHLQLHPACTTSSGAHDLVTSAISRGVTRISVCGTCPGDDWRAVERLCEQHEGNLLPNFGLHPWWIARYRTSSPETMPWDQQLCRLLEKHTVAGVGECGLDKAVKREVTIEEQEKILSSHISIASQYDRVLTLHCVGLWGRLLEMLAAVNTREPKPKAVILHSCNSMPAELVTAFDRLENVYFSLSAGNYGNAKFRRLALAIPKAKLLLETDSPDQLSSSLRVVASSNEPSFITYHCVQLATFLEMTHSELAQLTRQNAIRAYSQNYK